MSILANKDTHVVIQGGAAGLNAARRMAEFRYMIKQPLNVKAFVYPPDTGKMNEVTYGSGLLTIPVYKSVAEATSKHPEINTSLVYIGADRACAGGMEALNDPKIQLVSMITEGVPEKDAKLLARHAIKLGKTFNGPSSIGIISAGACRLGVIGGAFDNLVACKLYREGSFGVITKSGGLSNEIIWICSQFADGISTAIGIGGDAYPGTDYVTYLEKFEQDPQTKAVVIVGEMGGDLEERAAEWYGAKKRRVKLLAVVSGFCQESLPKGMKFGHAGAKEGMKGEGSARSKSDALKEAGAIVPDTFGALGPAIKQVYEDLVKSGQVRPIPELSPADVPKLPKTVEEGMKAGDVMVAPLIKTTISDDRGDEPCYDGYPASELINKGYEIPHVIGLLWDKRLISKQEAEIIKRIMMLSADHGPCVSDRPPIWWCRDRRRALFQVCGGQQDDRGRLPRPHEKECRPGPRHRPSREERQESGQASEGAGLVHQRPGYSGAPPGFCAGGREGDLGEEGEPDSERGRNDGGGAGGYRIPRGQPERLLHSVPHDRVDRPLGGSETPGKPPHSPL